MKQFLWGVLLSAVCAFGQQPIPECQTTVTGNVHTYRPEACQHAVHSRLFKFQAIDTIDNMLANKNFGTGELTLPQTGGVCEKITVSKEDGSTSTPLETAEYMGCDSDLVVVGTIENLKPVRNEANTYIYTDYEVQVKDVLKANKRARHAVKAGGTIVLARPGGELRIDGRRVIARGTCENERVLKTGEEVLLYLNHNPDSDTYRVMNDERIAAPDSAALARKALAKGCRQ